MGSPGSEFGVDYLFEGPAELVPSFSAISIVLEN
jgi:hypothetical protein